MSNDRAERLDALVATGAFPSRAAALTSAVDLLLAEVEQRSIDAAIVEGYTRLPQTAAEDAWARASALASIADEPW